MDSMHYTSSKTKKSGLSPTKKAAITFAMASSQVIKWYLPQTEGLHLEGSVSAGLIREAEQRNHWAAVTTVSYTSCF